MVSGSGLCAKVVVVDARHHMLGRLASILAKELLNGQKVVRLGIHLRKMLISRVCKIIRGFFINVDLVESIFLRFEVERN